MSTTTETKPTLLRSIPGRLVHFFQTGFRPLRVGRFEYFVMRLVFAWVVWQTIDKWNELPFEEQPFPAGLANFMDLTWLNVRANLDIMKWIGLAGLVVYVSGRALYLALPVVAFVQIAINSFYNSQGYTFHGHQLVGLVLFAQTMVVLVMAFYGWFWAGHRKRRLILVIPALMLFYSQMAIAGAYAVSVVSKHSNSKGTWLARSHYHAGQLIKIERQHYYSRVPEGGTPDSGEKAKTAKMIAGSPTLFRFMFGAGFFLELLVFLGMRNRIWALAVGAGIIFLHHSIYIIMSLSFPLSEYTAILFFMCPAFWLVRFLPRGKRYARPLPPFRFRSPARRNAAPSQEPAAAGA